MTSKALAIVLLVPCACVFSTRGQVTLRLVDWAGVEEAPLDQKAIACFEKLHPEIKVLYEPSSGRQYEEKILSALASGDPPDILLVDSKDIPTFANKNTLLNLLPYISELTIDTSQWYSHVLAIARRGHALYAFPKGFTPLMIFYNKKMFRAAGVGCPSATWTWDDYLRAALKLTRPRGNPGGSGESDAAFTNYFCSWIPWVWSAGGDVVSLGGRESSGYLNSPRTEAALQFLIDLRKRYHVTPDVGTWAQSEKTGANYQLFSTGKIAMIIDGHWRVPKFLQFAESGALDIGVAPLPARAGEKRVNVMYESGWCVPVNAPHPREAVLLAAFMAGEAACRIRAERRLEIPSAIAVARETVQSDTLGMEQSFLEEIPSCRQPWGSIIERFSEIEWTLQDAVDEVMINDRPMHETMTVYAARIDAELHAIRAQEACGFKPIREHSEIGRFLIAVALCVLTGCAVLYLTSARKHRAAARSALTFLAPSLLHLTVFIFTPIVFSAYLSVHRWDIVVADKPYVGAGNFAEIFGDAAFWGALRNTFLYTLHVPVSMAIALAIALMMHQRLRGIGFLRTICFLPSVTSLVAVALVWMWIYHPSFGIANFLLGFAGVSPLPWLNSTQTAMVSVMIFSIWLGYQMVIFLAGLQGIPEEFYEAARIDGATRWQLFHRVILPLLQPTTFFILVTSVIGSFQVFTSIYIMTAGGPVGSTDVIVYHIYQAAWEQLRMGYASAMSWILFVIVMIATWIQFRWLGRAVEYS